MKKSLQAKSLNRSDLKTVYGGMKHTNERGNNVTNLAPCQKAGGILAAATVYGVCV